MEARKRKRERKKQIKALYQAKRPIPPELQQSIPDPEAIWKADQEQLKHQLQLQEIEENDNEIEIIVNTTGDRSLEWLSQDYIMLSQSSEDEEDKDLSSSSSAESD